jgi:hypothetical protein
VLVPLYGGAGSNWDAVVQAKLNHPNTVVEAIVNPANGPGASRNSNFASSVASLRNAGVVVLGYVTTAQGTRPASAAEADIAAWQSFYGVDGVFLDEMPRVSGSEGYYSSLTAYAKGEGMTLVVGDPGGDLPESYVGSVDVLVIYEKDGMPPASAFTTHPGVARESLAYVALSVSTLDASAVRASRAQVGTLYVTSYSAPQAFFFVPPYLDDLVAAAGN